MADINDIKNEELRNLVSRVKDERLRDYYSSFIQYQ